MAAAQGPRRPGASPLLSGPMRPRRAEKRSTGGRRGRGRRPAPGLVGWSPRRPGRSGARVTAPDVTNGTCSRTAGRWRVIPAVGQIGATTIEPPPPVVPPRAIRDLSSAGWVLALLDEGHGSTPSGDW